MRCLRSNAVFGVSFLDCVSFVVGGTGKERHPMALTSEILTMLLSNISIHHAVPPEILICAFWQFRLTISLPK